MAAAPSPYNIVGFSLTDQSAIMRFFPHRDGLITDNWNVSYSDSSFADWSYDHNFGSGVSSHRTVLEGAYVVIDFAGIAVSVYGEAAGTFETVIDSEIFQPSVDTLASNLLFSIDDLPYGLHTAVLRVTEGEVSVTGADIFLALGDAGTYTTVHNISAVDTSTSPHSANPLFVGDAADWSVATLYTNQTADGYPCLTTSTYGATLTFTLNETVAFMLLGSDDWAQGLFTVAVSSDTPGATSSVTDNTIQYSPRSLWTQLDVPKYIASGLDSNATYTVQITNLGANFNLASVAVYGETTHSTSSAAPSSSPTGSHTVNSQSSQSMSSSSSSASGTASAAAGTSKSNATNTRRLLTGTKLVGFLLLVMVVTIL